MRKQSFDVCGSILKELELHMEDARKSMQDAARNMEWSNAAGFRGIETGLMLAEQIVKNHMKSISSPARNPRSISGNAPSLH